MCMQFLLSSTGEANNYRTKLLLLGPTAHILSFLKTFFYRAKCKDRLVGDVFSQFY